MFDIRKNEHSTSKVINMYASYYEMQSASCIHGSHVVDVSARHGWGISWYPSHGLWSALQLGYCSLACDANHVAWRDRRPGCVAQFRNLMPSLWAHRAAGMGVYITDNSRAFTDPGSLMCYMRGGVFDGTFKGLCASWFAFMATLTQRC